MNEKIPRRAYCCTQDGERFLPGAEYVSLLTETKTGWKRADYCLACWKKEPKKKAVQYWRGKIPLKKEVKKTMDPKALELFKTLKDPKLLSVLALYLQRKGQISKIREEKECIDYEILETGEVIHIT